jgi:hypothetical protein
MQAGGERNAGRGAKTRPEGVSQASSVEPRQAKGEKNVGRVYLAKSPELEVKGQMKET